LIRFVLPLAAFAALAPSFGALVSDKGTSQGSNPEVKAARLPASARDLTPVGADAAGFTQPPFNPFNPLIDDGGPPPYKIGAMVEGGQVGPNGKEILCDVPESLRKRNIGSPPPNGPGCCVFRSIDYAAIYHSIPQLHGFPEWMVENRVQGGGWPEKVDKLIPEICRSRGMPVPGYVQHVAGDIQFLWAAMKTRRICCVTYAGNDPHYGRMGIDHMVNIVYMDEPGTANGQVCVCDNNFPKNAQLLWMSEAEFTQRWKSRGGGWAIAFLAPPPPPVPHN
jgi:hypothetical protein